MAKSIIFFIIGKYFYLLINQFVLLQINFIFLIKALGFLNGLLCANKASDQYYSWLIGNPSDFKLADESRLDGGILLAGGGTDQDSAMKWFLKKALGGDVIVFRNGRNSSVSEYPTADGYNSYLFSELGVNVDSVETIFLNSRNVANNLEVVDKVRKAEAVFFTGIRFKDVCNILNSFSS